jgi:hypothetical protein
MEAVRFSETLVNFCPTIRRKIKENTALPNPFCENLKSNRSEILSPTLKKFNLGNLVCMYLKNLKLASWPREIEICQGAK